jgi:Transcription elongation factor, N-terminal
MAKVPLTTHGAELLRQELHRLKTVERPSAIAAIAEARSHGDLSENAEYDAAKERQSSRAGSTKSSRNLPAPRSSTRSWSMPRGAACSAPPSSWKTRRRASR